MLLQVFVMTKNQALFFKGNERLCPRTGYCYATRMHELKHAVDCF